MGVISFTSITDSFNLKNKKKISDWIQKVILAHHKYPVSISYIFCNDQYLLDLNKKHLQHNTLTDIITFNYNETFHISGDIFISIERVKENAEQFKTTFEEELQRVMVHGILHLLGYNDKSANQKKQMAKKENEFLAMLDI